MRGANGTSLEGAFSRKLEVRRTILDENSSKCKEPIEAIIGLKDSNGL